MLRHQLLRTLSGPLNFHCSGPRHSLYSAIIRFSERSFEPGRFATDYVKKPLYSREGANVTIARAGATLEAGGEYGEEGFVWQADHPLPQFAGNYTVIGSWVVGDAPAGIGLREDDSPITRNSSRFVPHYFEP